MQNNNEPFGSRYEAQKSLVLFLRAQGGIAVFLSVFMTVLAPGPISAQTADPFFPDGAVSCRFPATIIGLADVANINNPSPLSVTFDVACSSRAYITKNQVEAAYCMVMGGKAGERFLKDGKGNEIPFKIVPILPGYDQNTEIGDGTWGTALFNYADIVSYNTPPPQNARYWR